MFSKKCKLRSTHIPRTIRRKQRFAVFDMPRPPFRSSNHISLSESTSTLPSNRWRRRSSPPPRPSGVRRCRRDAQSRGRPRPRAARSAARATSTTALGKREAGPRIVLRARRLRFPPACRETPPRCRPRSSRRHSPSAGDRKAGADSASRLCFVFVVVPSQPDENGASRLFLFVSAADFFRAMSVRTSLNVLLVACTVCLIYAIVVMVRDGAGCVLGGPQAYRAAAGGCPAMTRLSLSDYVPTPQDVNFLFRMACRANSPSTVSSLIRRLGAATATAVAENGDTPLHECAKESCLECCATLIEAAGADPSLENPITKMTPTQSARSAKMFELLHKFEKR